MKIKFLNGSERDVELSPGARLADANLHGARLADADLRYANLIRADLRDADLRRADLRRADLWGADLSWADLSWADLSEANLSGADLWRTNLIRADLRDADLRDADLRGAKTDEATKWSDFQIPQDVELTVFKKLRDGVIATLRVSGPRTASLVGKKCRAREAFVVELSSGTEGRSLHDESCVYRVGETVSCPDYNDDPKVECTQGIHFFMTRKEAEEY